MGTEVTGDTSDMDVEAIGSLLLKISSDLDNLTRNAHVLVNKDVNSFVNGKLGSHFGPAIKLYSELFKTIGVRSRTELENEIKKNFRNQEVRDSFEGLLECETSWNKLVGSLDEHLSKSQSTNEIKLGEVCGEEIDLVDTRSGTTTSISSLLGSLDYSFLHCVLLRHFA